MLLILVCNCIDFGMVLRVICNFVRFSQFSNRAIEYVKTVIEIKGPVHQIALMQATDCMQHYTSCKSSVDSAVMVLAAHGGLYSALKQNGTLIVFLFL